MKNISDCFGHISSFVEIMGLSQIFNLVGTF
jgi:hypothetical protein